MTSQAIDIEPPAVAGPVAPSKPLRRFWNVPNTLTISRLGFAAIVFGLIAGGAYFSALAAFAVAALTDMLDGYLARRLGQVSAIGRQLDPLVDKVIVIGTLVYLLPIPGTGLAPWMVAAIVARELIVQAIRSLVEGRGVAFGARTSGKLKTVVQCLSIAGILLILGLGGSPSPAMTWVRDGLTWAAVGLTLYSGSVYLVVAWPHLKAEAQAP